MWVPWRTYRAPDALGPLELVGPQRHEVGAEHLDVEIDVGRGLHRVDVEQDALSAADHVRDPRRSAGSVPTSLLASMIETRIVRSVSAPSTSSGIHPPVAIDWQFHDLEPELLEVAQGMAHCMMLDGGSHDPVAVALACPRRALEREVAGLGSARCEHDLASLRVEAGGHAFVRLVEPSTGRPAKAVGRARIAIRLGEVRQHRVEDLASKRSRGRVIEVDRHPRDCTSRLRHARTRRVRPCPPEVVPTAQANRLARSILRTRPGGSPAETATLGLTHDDGLTPSAPPRSGGRGVLAFDSPAQVLGPAGLSTSIVL